MKNSLEDIFKNKFADYRPDVPTDMWTKINKAFHNFVLKRIIAIFSILFTLSLSFVYFYSIKTNDDNREGVKKTVNSTYIIRNFRIAKITQKIEAENKSLYRKNNILSRQNSKVTHIAIAPKTLVHKNKIPYKKEQIADTNIIKSFSLSQRKGCLPLNITICDNIAQAKDLKWEINGEKYYDKKIIEVSFDKAGTYRISLIENVEGKEVTFIDSVTAFQRPHADIVVPAKIPMGKQIVFENNCKGADNYQWFINGTLVSKAENLIYNFYSEAKVNLELVATNNNNCTDTCRKIIDIEKQKEYIIFPSAFSPNIFGSCNGYYNSDAKFTNEVFRPYVFDKKVEKYNLKVFNRAGKLIFESNNLNQGWDGYFNNKLVPVDVYIYVAKGTFDDGKSFSRQGSITVIYNKN